METNQKNITHKIVLVLTSAALCIGAIVGLLLLRLHYFPWGRRTWLTACLQTGGCPILILPIWISSSCRENPPSEDSHVTPKLFLECVVLGLLTGLSNFSYAWVFSYLPLPTMALVGASQLAFNAAFAFLLVNQKFTPYSINAVILLTMGPVLLASQNHSDIRKSVTAPQYWLAIFVTITAAALYGITLPLIELVYKKIKPRMTYLLVVEMQLIMYFSATVLCTAGMAINKDFEGIAREARASVVGEFDYYMALVSTAICWQLFYIGVFEIIFLTSSLFTGILIALFIPVTDVATAIISHDKFNGKKCMAVVMALWGFTSYLYGEYKTFKLQQNDMA